jgi:uncharacterized protein YjbJ (UPF0337 family)
VDERTDRVSSRGFASDSVTGVQATGDTSDPDVIVAEIEQTREAMSETINSIQDKLDPDRLSAQAISTASEVTEQAVTAATEVTVQARDAAIEVTRYAIDEAKAAVRELADQAKTTVRASTVGRIEEMAAYSRSTAQAAQTDLMSLVKQNPVPAALAAISLGWLWSHRSGGSYRPGYGSERCFGSWDSTRSQYGSAMYGTDSGVNVKEQARQVAGQVVGQMQERAGLIQEKAGQVQQQVGQIPGQIPLRADQVQQQAVGFWQMIESNPIAMGAMGLVVGGIVGMMLPETEQEQRLLGGTRDQVIGSVQDVAGQTLQKVQNVAKEAASAAAEEVKSQGMMPKSGSGSNAMST